MPSLQFPSTLFFCSKLPPGVASLPVDEATASTAYTYDLGLASDTPDGSDNLYAALNVFLQLRDGMKMHAIKPFLAYFFRALEKLPVVRGMMPAMMMMMMMMM